MISPPPRELFERAAKQERLEELHRVAEAIYIHAVTRGDRRIAKEISAVAAWSAADAFMAERRRRVLAGTHDAAVSKLDES